MSADDDGFVGNPKTIKLISGATDDDLKILIAKQFIIPFDSGVIVIKDWRIHNYIQKDRYNKTQYLEEKSQLFVEENGAYTKCIQNVSKMDTQVRLGKERLGKENIYIVEQSPTEYLFPEWLEEKYVEQVKKGNPKNFDYRIPIAYLNQKTNSNYKFVDSNINLVKARLRDGYNLDDFKAVVDKKHGEWGNSDMAKYLRPSTLFNASKFESYLNQPAQVVTAKSAFEKKADTHPQFDGKEAGVIYLQDGEIKYSKGAFIPKGAEILGGWAKVYRKDRTYPTETEVSFEEYDNSKIRARVKELTQQGKDITYPVMNSYGKPIGENNWDTMPCVMIRKVALVSAYREAFPAELGSSYEADEIQLDNIPKDVTPQETQEEVRARKMAQIEQMKQEQAQKQTQKTDTTYTADKVSEYTDEPMQGELLDGELEY